MVSSILDISAKSEIKAKVRCPWECAGTRLEFKKVWSHLRGTANDDTQPLGERIDSTEEREMPAEGWPHAMATWRRLGRGRRTEKQRKKNNWRDPRRWTQSRRMRGRRGETRMEGAHCAPDYKNIHPIVVLTVFSSSKETVETCSG